jgi:23S rRNA (guanosine2251-2'-O)-methyltransferase
MSETSLIYGFHAVLGRLRQKAGSVREIYLDRERSDPRARELAAFARERGVKLLLVEGARLDGLTSHARHQGVAARVESVRPAQDLDAALAARDEAALLLVLDGVTDPHNLGACLRVADAMGAHAVLAPKDRAAGINATVEKVASGAAETVPFLAVTNLARAMRDLKERGIWLIVLGTVESLNVSVTAGICLAETRRQRVTKSG